jgi:hypothetical protein
MDQGRVSLNVDPGVCRLKAKVECWMENDLLRCSISSGCKHVEDFAKALENEGFDMMEVMRMPFAENKAYIIGGRTLKHSTCPLPLAVLKGMEVAAGLALKRDVLVNFDK